MANAAKSVAVIGAGFSGALATVHLLRSAIPGSVRVSLISRTVQMGKGLAYGTSSESHVLNVPAGQMSAFVDDPNHFLIWLRRLNPRAQAHDFVRRYLYGRYIEEQVNEAQLEFGDALDTVVGKVVDVVPTRSASLSLGMSDGRQLEADRVVLAIGNFPPLDPPAEDNGFYQSSRYVRDPWANGRLDQINESDTVLLLGTGLTMVDVATDLFRLGVRRIIAVSRRGLLSKSHRYTGRAPSVGLIPADLMDQPATVRGYLRKIRKQLARGVADGIDWREVIGELRPHTATLWDLLDRREKRRFVRHLKPYWEVHRHRIAPETSILIERLIADGLLSILAGRVLRYEPTAEDVCVHVRPRGQTATAAMRVNWVVNCTGPGTDIRAIDDPLMQSLLAQRLIQPDPLGLGLAADQDGRLFDGAGKPSPFLFHVGPMLKGLFWECTAVPELRAQMRRLASVLLQDDYRDSGNNFPGVGKDAPKCSVHASRYL